MTKENRLTIGLIVFLVLFATLAIIKEKKEQKNSYIQGIPSDKDSQTKIYKRIVHCLTTDTKTIKWRRSVLSALLITFLIFSLVLCRLPEPRELVLTFFIVYSVYYTMWLHHVKTTIVPSVNYGKENLRRLRNARRTRLPTIFKFPTV